MRLTKDEVITMALEAAVGDSHGYFVRNMTDGLVRFAELVAQAERKRIENHFYDMGPQEMCGFTASDEIANL